MWHRSETYLAYIIKHISEEVKSILPIFLLEFTSHSKIRVFLCFIQCEIDEPQIYLCLLVKHQTFQLQFSPFSSGSTFSGLRELRYFISIFQILKIFQNGGSRWRVQLFPRYSYKNWYEGWHIHFSKTYDHQIWQAIRYRGVD